MSKTMRIAWLVCLLGATLTAAQAAAAPGTDTGAGKIPVPDQASQEKAEKTIKEVFKDEYTHRKPADLLALAAKLVQQAEESKDDPAARFVLLREARDLAARAGDAEEALKAADEMIQVFAVNAPEMKAGVLETLARAPTTPTAGKALGERALALVDEAIQANDYAVADRLLKVASTAARLARSLPLSTAAQSRRKDVQAIEAEYRKAQESMALLMKNPEDPALNLTVGRFYCLWRGDWERGLPLLVRGSDKKLKALAQKDLEAPLDPAAQVQLGDRWWELGQAEKGQIQRNLLRRAVSWYSQAEPSLTGLTQTRIAKRLKDLDTQLELRKPVEWFVLFRSADPSLWNMDVNKGRSQFARALDKAPEKIRYLRLMRMDRGAYVIVEVTKAELKKQVDNGRYCWEGRNAFAYQGHQLGIYDRELVLRERGSILLEVTGFGQGYSGWGFGMRGYLNDQQGYCWAGKPIPKTVMEIAVTAGPLSEAESKKLLKKTKSRP
jgi:hypothetical protein